MRLRRAHSISLSLSLTHTPYLFLQNSHGVFVSGGETKKKATQKKSLGPKSPRAHHARDVTVAAAANVGHVFARWRQLAPEQPRPTHFSSPFNDPRSMIMKFEPHKKKINGPKFVFEEWGNGLKSVEKLNQPKIQKLMLWSSDYLR